MVISAVMKSTTDMAAFKARGLLTLPEYHWWYNVIQQGDVDTIKDVLSKSSKEQKDTLLNGKFVNTKHDRCEIKIRNNSDCRAMMTKGMVFRYTWVYSKEDTMAHTRRPVVTS